MAKITARLGPGGRPMSRNRRAMTARPSQMVTINSATQIMTAGAMTVSGEWPLGTPSLQDDNRGRDHHALDEAYAQIADAVCAALEAEQIAHHRAFSVTLLPTHTPITLSRSLNA